MSEAPLFEELCRLLREAGVEVRIEPFKVPPDSAGGLCVMKGARLVLLHSGASRSEQVQALLEVLEKIGLEPLGLTGVQLSPELLARLNMRGKMSWPHRSEAPKMRKADPSPRKHTLIPTNKRR